MNTMHTTIDSALGATRSGEATGLTLDNHDAPVASHVAPAKAVGRTPPPEVEQVKTDATQVAPGALSIVRATCRILLDVAVLAADRREHIAKRCGGTEGGCKACQLQQELRGAQREAVRAANAAMRVHWRADADILDQALLATGAPPAKAADWKRFAQIDPERLVRAVSPGLSRGETKLAAGELVKTSKADKTYLSTYRLVRVIAPDLPGGIASAISDSVQSKWQRERFASLVRCTKSPPHYTGTMPLPLRAADCALTHCVDDDYEFTFAIRGGLGHRWTLPISARDGATKKRYLAKLLSELAGSNVKFGACQISEDRMRPGRWFVRIAYTRRVDAAVVGKNDCAIHLGIVNFMAALGSDGERFIIEGNDIRTHLAQIQARRRSYQRQIKYSNRTGRGREAALAASRKLAGAHERWVDTTIQRIARSIANWVKEHGYSRVYMPDFTRVRDSVPELLERSDSVYQWLQEWPYYRMQQAIRSCLEEVGIGCNHECSGSRARPPTCSCIAERGSGVDDGVLSRHACPACGETEALIEDLGIRTFRCESCGHHGPLDVVLAELILARGRERRGDSDSLIGENGSKLGPPKGKNGGARKASRKYPKSKGPRRAGSEESSVCNVIGGSVGARSAS